jgi:hypothetical protein
MMQFLGTRIPLVEERQKRRLAAADPTELYKQLVELQKVRQQLVQSQSYVLSNAMQQQGIQARAATDITVANIQASADIGVAHEKTYGALEEQYREQRFQLANSQQVSDTVRRDMAVTAQPSIEQLAGQFRAETDPRKKQGLYVQAVRNAAAQAKEHMAKADANGLARTSIAKYALELVDTAFNIAGSEQLSTQERAIYRNLGSAEIQAQTKEMLDVPEYDPGARSGGRGGYAPVAPPTLQEATPPAPAQPAQAPAPQAQQPASQPAQAPAAIPYDRADNGTALRNTGRVTSDGAAIYEDPLGNAYRQSVRTDPTGKAIRVYQGIGGTEVLSPSQLAETYTPWAGEALGSVRSTEDAIRARIRAMEAAAPQAEEARQQIALELFDKQPHPLQGLIDSPEFQGMSEERAADLLLKAQALVSTKGGERLKQEGKAGDEEEAKKQEQLKKGGYEAWVPTQSTTSVFEPAFKQARADYDKQLNILKNQLAAKSITQDQYDAAVRKAQENYDWTVSDYKSKIKGYDQGWQTGKPPDLAEIAQTFKMPEEAQRTLVSYVQRQNARQPDVLTFEEEIPGQEQIEKKIDEGATKALAKEAGEGGDVKAMQAGQDIAMKLVEGWKEQGQSDDQVQFNIDRMVGKSFGNASFQKGFQDYMTQQRSQVAIPTQAEVTAEQRAAWTPPAPTAPAPPSFTNPFAGVGSVRTPTPIPSEGGVPFTPSRYSLGAGPPRVAPYVFTPVPPEESNKDIYEFEKTYEASK